MAYIRKNIFCLLTLTLISILSLMPAQEFPQMDVQFADKWAHWVMYGFLTSVMGGEYILHTYYYNKKAEAHKKKGTTIWRFLSISLFASLYGGLMELGQAYLTTSRHGDWLDVWANCFGAICALICLLIYHFSAGKRI